MWASPKPKFKPAVWRFAAAKSALDQAGEFVPVEQAERRNLIMVNPIEGNIYATSRNLVAAYQMVKAGETARSHRHTAAALRLVVQAKPGTYTVVDGARVDMLPGDVVLTPSWCWHGHANESDETSYWIDFLDVRFVQHSEAPTIGLHLWRLPSGTRRAVPKTTVNNLYSVISGKARVKIDGGVEESLAVGDVITVPCWHAHTIVAERDAIVFRVTDEPLLAKVGLVKTG